MRILVLSPDPLPLPGMPVRPLGLRAWSLAFGLRSSGMADVRIALPAPHGTTLPPIPGLEVYEKGGEAELLKTSSPDVLVVVSPDCLLALPALKCPVVLDVTRPQPTPNGVATMRKAVLRADIVSCATKTAVHFLSPLMLEAGFDPGEPLTIPVCVAPDSPPVPSRNGAPSVLALRLDGEFSRDELLPIRLVVDGKPGAAFDVVSSSDNIAFDGLLSRLARADLVLTARPPSSARALHPSDDTLLAMWAGVPVIHDADDSLADAITASRAGWSADEDVARIVARLLSKPDDMRRRAPRASGLVQASYTWDRAVKPLLEWLDQGPRKRPHANRAPVEESTAPARTTRLRRGEISAAQSPLGRISYAPPPPAPEKATPIGMGMTIVAMALLLPVGIMLLLLFALAEVVRLLFPQRPPERRRRQ